MKLRVVEILSVVGHKVSISLVSYYGLLVYNSCSLYQCFGGTHCDYHQG
jgi:hypothetical protein